MVDQLSSCLMAMVPTCSVDVELFLEEVAFQPEALTDLVQTTLV